MIKLLLLFGVFLSFSLNAIEPVMRIGVVTDTHVKKSKNSCELLKGAFKVFKQHHAKMIINVGDIADVYNEQAYRNYRDTVSEVFPDAATRPLELFVYANHDVIGRKKENPFKVFKDVKKHLHISHDPYHIQEFKGYYFLIVPQFVNMKIYSEMLKEVAAKAGDKPFFVIDHIPAPNTTNGAGGNSKRKELLSKYPQTVVLCGHAHSTLTNERAIWQGEYTAVNAGALHTYGIALQGVPRQTFPGDMFLLLEVYKDKLVFRRFSASTQKEYKADAPWSIPLPFDPKTAPYRTEKRYAEEIAPEFAPGSAVKIQNTDRQVGLIFPAAVGDVFVYDFKFYRRRDSKWQLFAEQGLAGNAVTPEYMRSQNMTASVDIGLFVPGEENKLVITPRGFFGKCGKSIEKTFSINNAAKSETVFESRNPMEELKFMTGLRGGRIISKDKDGFYLNDSNNSRLEFPENVWSGKKGTVFRFTIEMHTIQGNDSWSIVLRNPVPLRNARHRIDTPTGNSGVRRYVITFTKPRESFWYYLLIREGGKGKVKFDYVKIEKL